MESKEQQLMELLGLTARSLTHLTASMTSMSFELLRSDDKVTREAARRMIDRHGYHQRRAGRALAPDRRTDRSAGRPRTDRNPPAASVAGAAQAAIELIGSGHRLA